MSIRLIALELYRLRKVVDELEKRAAAARPEQIEPLKDKLRKARAEHTRMRRVLDGQIDRPPRSLR